MEKGDNGTREQGVWGGAEKMARYFEMRLVMQLGADLWMALYAVVSILKFIRCVSESQCIDCKDSSSQIR